ncbi:MAG: replication-associated recombination protein A [Candidatus Omnitrophica bacterium]|nr:replication-associated recombination protein A [Candidatus Omnitrophota bacterium]
MDLFTEENLNSQNKNLPLAVRLRPTSLDQLFGQDHILGKNKLLRRAIEADRLTSLILFGPPGVGKTSLAWCIANITQANYVAINATTSNVEELRKIIAASKLRAKEGKKKTILFIDEIHRFNKAQQDVLLPDVEEGRLVLIGATVHNPYFSLTSALLSRSIVCELKELQSADLLNIIDLALKNREKGLGNFKVKLDKKALNFLAKSCEGDARRVLSALELGVLTTPADKDGYIHFDLEIAQESIQKKAVVYDRDGDGHYDTASAFIKSMRGSDPDAAIYWMAKMLYAGEDPRFIARRICILASEDVGNADPLALVLANAALQVCEFVGMPEARIPLAQAVTYVACAPKSNASYLAVEKATRDIQENKVQEVPDHLKDASYDGARELGHGLEYKYSHDYPGHYVKQQYMRKKMCYYEPTDLGHEAKIKERLEKLRQASSAADKDMHSHSQNGPAGKGKSK